MLKSTEFTFSNDWKKQVTWKGYNVSWKKTSIHKSPSNNFLDWKRAEMTWNRLVGDRRWEIWCSRSGRSADSRVEFSPRDPEFRADPDCDSTGGATNGGKVVWSEKSQFGNKIVSARIWIAGSDLFLVLREENWLSPIYQVYILESLIH